MKKDQQTMFNYTKGTLDRLTRACESMGQGDVGERMELCEFIELAVFTALEIVEGKGPAGLWKASPGK